MKQRRLFTLASIALVVVVAFDGAVAQLTAPHPHRATPVPAHVVGDPSAWVPFQHGPHR